MSVPDTHMRWGWPTALIVVFLMCAFVLPVTPELALADPHGGYSPLTAKCAMCHELHEAAGDPGITHEDELSLCYGCHDGTGSIYDTKGVFETTGTGSSRHPVPDEIDCTSCHTPHEGPAEGNLMALSAGPSKASTGTAVCGACHGSGSTLPGGDVVTPIDGTQHGGLGDVSSAVGIACSGCHEHHASSVGSLLKTTVTRPDGSTVTVDSVNAVCVACHEVRASTYPGSDVALASKHAVDATSSKAAASYPGTGQEPGDCGNCHEPHGASGYDALTRAPASDLCTECHDTAGTSYPADYSYQGSSTLQGTPHGAIDARYAYVNLTSTSEEFSAWESTTQPTPASPGQPITEPRISPMKTIDTSYTVTHLATTSGQYDYQMYRFYLEEPPADVRTLQAVWRGFGEEVASNPVDIYVWDAISTSWDQLASQQLAQPETLRLALDVARNRDGGGYVYVMARARNVDDTNITAQPTLTRLSSTSVRITWATEGLTDSWVDYGPTTAYGTTVGSSARVTNHSVTLTGLTSGIWNYRIRSASQDGAAYTSSNMTFGVPGATLVPVPDYLGFASASVTMTWSAPSAAHEPFDYRVHIWTDGYDYMSPWLGDVSTHTVTLSGDHLYTWAVESKDASGTNWGWSLTDQFYVWASSSCPFLFTYDGTEHAFEADLYGAGKLALKTSRGYTRPEPNDYYVLNNEPALLDGKLDLRLVEERYEVDYLDELKLYSIDASAGVRVIAEKPQAPGERHVRRTGPRGPHHRRDTLCTPECRARADRGGRALQDRVR